MVQRPGSLPEFEIRFPDDAACARWLFGKRWPDGFRCPGCGHAKGWELNRGALLIECARCRRQTSVTAGTVLHRSHLPGSVSARASKYRCAELKPVVTQAASKMPVPSRRWWNRVVA